VSVVTSVPVLKIVPEFLSKELFTIFTTANCTEMLIFVDGAVSENKAVRVVCKVG
jgi:hypothetical protein